MTDKVNTAYEPRSMEEVIVQDRAQENSGLLNAKEKALGSAQTSVDQESQIFWLELLAMFIFIYGSTCSKYFTGVDLAFFTGIMMAIPICARQTGANLNPAVSYSMLLKNNSSSSYSLIWLYFKAQAIGAIISMVVATVLNDVHRGPLSPVDHTVGELLRMIISEAVGVFVLIFFVLYATGPLTFVKTEGVKYFYIAVFVYIGRKFAAVSGNQINVALTLSQAFVGIPTCHYEGFKYLFIWLLGDALGVVLASQFYANVLAPTLEYLSRKKRIVLEEKMLVGKNIEMREIK